MGCPGGMSTICCTRLVLEIWSFRLSPNNSGGKGDHYYIQTRHNDVFSLYNRVLKTLQEKMSQKALVNTKRNVLMPPSPGHPTIPLKSNLLNMAAVSGKRSIGLQKNNNTFCDLS